MKLAVSIASENAPRSAFVVWRGFEDSIRKAAAFGYEGVELALKTADEVCPRKLAKWLTKNSLEVSCITTGQVFASLGLYFTHPKGEVRREVVSLFDEFASLAKDFGQMINVGRTRGYIDDGQSRDDAESFFLETADEICEAAEKKGVIIVIEPVNRYEINFVNSTAECLELVERFTHSNIGIMPDTFHMNIEEVDIRKSLRTLGKCMRYIHFADSNRRAPGDGHIDFDEVFRGMRDAEYDGWGAIEVLPLPDADSAARKSAEYLLPLIASYNAGEY